MGLEEAFYHKWIGPGLPITTRDLTGRIVVVTGANIGLGFEAAKHFYSMKPARLVLAVRTMSKGEQAKKAIITADSGSSPTQVDVWQLDLSSFDSTKAFAAKVNEELDRLDVFLANAAIASAKWNQTTDGWESTIQVNVLSTFLLAALVVPLLKKTAKLPAPVPAVDLRPHIVIVTSAVHADATFPQRSASNIFNALNDKGQFVIRDRYQTSKLLVVLLTRELAHSVELKGEDVVVCNVNPGFCRSELMREVPFPIRQILYGIFARTTEEGSRTYLWASLTDDIAPGSYSSSCAVIKPAAFVTSTEGQAVQKKLWNEMQEVLIKVAPETANVWKTA